MQAVDLNAPVGDAIFALLYGGSGTGKTDFAGTLGEIGYTLIIDIDMGGMTLKTSARDKPFRNNTVLTTFDKFGDLDTAYRYVLRNDPKEWSKVLGVEITKPFDWIVWDSWTELQWSMLQELRTDEGLDPKTPTKLDFRKNIGIQHWGMLTDLNKLSVESLRDASKTTHINQLFIMLETISKDELSGQIYGGPAIHGKLVAEMPGYFNIVAHSYTDLSGKYCIATKSKGRWPAKTRLGEGIDKANVMAKDIFTLPKH